MPMFKPEAKDETEELFAKLFKMGGSAVLSHEFLKTHGLSIVTKETWLYGNMPMDAFCSGNPFSTAMMKVLAAGVSKWLLFDAASAHGLLQQQASSNKTWTTEALREELRNLSLEAAEKLRKAGLTIVGCEQEAWSVLYVPTGWIALETTTGPGSLLYGVRKSLVVATEGAQKSYAAAKLLQDAAAKPTENIERVLAAMAAHKSPPAQS